MDSMKGSAMALAIVGLVLGGVIGYTVGASDDDSETTQTTQQSPVSDEASDLRLALNTELKQHVTQAAVALRSIAINGADSETTAAAVSELDNNSVAIAGLVGSVYPEQEEAFLSLWREHIGFFVSYTQGVLDGDEDVQQQTLDDLAGYGEQATAFFTETAGLDLPPETVKSLLVGHRDLVVAAVDSLAAGDIEGYFANEAAAYDQMGEIADALAGAIAEQQNL
ncbi:TPA: hypothetical protein EYO12_01885 [Candidatus Saccharibacteria bacterium]|jgi:hypothetical protein|nr:hypothetical protein [Candidatus Saccharibacteria bacterium]HIO87468.1 hypothetical protein [Candidatus Saccharibacteria bacterium]